MVVEELIGEQQEPGSGVVAEFDGLAGPQPPRSDPEGFAGDCVLEFESVSGSRLGEQGDERLIEGESQILDSGVGEPRPHGQASSRDAREASVLGHRWEEEPDWIVVLGLVGTHRLQCLT